MTQLSSTTPTPEQQRARRLFVDVSILLPEGKTCSDCVFFASCESLFQCSGANEFCGWAPSHFRQT